MSDLSTGYQIFRYVTNKNILEIRDLLHLEPRRSKVCLTLVEYDKNFKATAQVRHYADADMFKLICWDILTRQFPRTFAVPDTYQHQGDPRYRPLARWIEHKGSPVEGGFEARTLEIQYLDPQQWKNPYSIRIRRGVGEQIGQGAVKMVKVEEEVAMLLPEADARRMALTVFDYLRAWETVNLRTRQKAYFASREAGREQEVSMEDLPAQEAQSAQSAPAAPPPPLPPPAVAAGPPAPDVAEEAVSYPEDFFDDLFDEPLPPRGGQR